MSCKCVENLVGIDQVNSEPPTQVVAVQTGVQLKKPIPVYALVIHLLPKATHKTQPLTLIISGNHHENLSFDILSAPCWPLIVVHLWLILKPTSRLDQQ